MVTTKFMTLKEIIEVYGAQLSPEDLIAIDNMLNPKESFSLKCPNCGR